MNEKTDAIQEDNKPIEENKALLHSINQKLGYLIILLVILVIVNIYSTMSIRSIQTVPEKMAVAITGQTQEIKGAVSGVESSMLLDLNQIYVRMGEMKLY